MSVACWKYELTVPGPAASAFAEALAPLADAVSLLDVSPSGGWRVLAYGTGAADEAALVAAVAGVARAAGLPPPPGELVWLPAVDWLAENRESFAPFRVGRFHIHDSQHPIPAPAIEIDAATAFGSGLHASTRGCLMALERLARARSRGPILDLGCGSGILAVAAAKSLRAPVLAADIDPEAVRVTRLNARHNRVAGLVRATVSDGFRARAVGEGAPYALVLANILARPLKRMAPDLARHLAPGGAVVLSGLLQQQERQVLAAHLPHGLVLAARRRLEGWSTLVLAKAKRPRRSGRPGRRSCAAVATQAVCGRFSSPAVPRNRSTAPSRSPGLTPMSSRMFAGMPAS